jgi:murein DD-endopeptidase MepM/ murein hydrolase activator NlpD
MRHQRLLALLLFPLLAGCFGPRVPAGGSPRVAADREYLRTRELMVPVDGVRPDQLTDTYNARRSGGRAHHALDIMARRGTPVLSADDGIVRRISTNTLGGRTVYVVDLQQQFVHYYAHLDEYARGLREGDRVRKGDRLGTVGSTGNADRNAPHLHYQLLRYANARMWWAGDPVNPVPYLIRRGNER